MPSDNVDNDDDRLLPRDALKNGHDDNDNSNKRHRMKMDIHAEQILLHAKL